MSNPYLMSNPSDIQNKRFRQERSRLRKQLSDSIRNEVKLKNDININNSSNAAWKIFKESTDMIKSQYGISYL